MMFVFGGLGPGMPPPQPPPRPLTGFHHRADLGLRRRGRPTPGQIDDGAPPAGRRHRRSEADANGKTHSVRVCKRCNGDI